MNNTPEFHRIALIAKPDDTSEDLVNTLRQAITFLGERGLEVFPDRHTARALGLSRHFATEEMGHRCDLAIIVGGDGTFLSSARRLGDSQIPLLGVNLGRLGFLVDISPDAMRDTLGNVLDGRYEEEERFLLSCQVGEQPPELALNDVVLHKWNTARMIEFETWVDDSFIDTQRSDGIIVSTPTGSTAYALSGGGPLLSPALDAIALVPICPHTLSNRPIVVHGRNVVRLRVCGKTLPDHVRVTCDGQVTLEVGPGEDVVLRRHSPPLRLIHPAGHDHFQILRTKLHWGGKHS
ncbi:NAD(+) kinase [endosymbiont of unidentified scaly snail isolate Monju]|uniref:NAD(+) kinase n=1 Tax=endosymbiont of unidentified scaly snail isolate Monju TaxID=1248727 RepID=UPI0003892660|nr:NAD(+) kinase [endosymbiont of unidentified scaly snail isolate Monju]BAN68998.1 NAD+ kinase [endosymbiont of unidentified scaly snail isolate Monju]